MELFNYLLKVSACSVLFFGFYLLVLRKLTFFKINRFYLLASVLISFIIPALQFSIERTVAAPIADVNSVMAPDASQKHDLAEVDLAPVVLNASPIEQEVERLNWLKLLPYLYGAVSASLLLLTARRIIQLLKHTKYSVKEINGLKLVAKDRGFTNCSFFNYVFIDENSLSEPELTVLLAHEAVHAKQYHSVDKLLMMIAKAVLWFNPVIYLYDKALEEAHEYEADETTAKSAGTEFYASLLLKLAVSKSTDPLIHNFVKSPIKQRIKMLFNSKTKNMKKLAYLLALPIGLGLIWGFTIKVTHRLKPAIQQETVQLQDTLSGKMITGKIISFEKSKMGEVINLQVGNKIVQINCFAFKSKVKIGDEIRVSVGGKNSLPPPPKGSITTTDAKGNKSIYTGTFPYMASKVMGANGKLIYETPKYAFLYEANRARYAWSNIISINKNESEVIEKIVLKDKNGFIINLNIGKLNLKTNNFSKGDAIVVKFIGEKLTGLKTYTTDKMIALYSWPKKHELINKALYSKFYYENGRQKLSAKYERAKISEKTNVSNLSALNFSKPTLLTSDSIKISNKTQTTLVKKAIMRLFNGELTADEVEMDSKMEIITARKAKFTREKENTIAADVMVFNSATGAFTIANHTEKAIRTYK